MKKILALILCLSMVVSSAVPSLAMGFQEDTSLGGGLTYTDDTRYQVFDGVVYDMFWGIPDSIAQLYGLHKVTRYQELPYWVVCLGSSSSTISNYTKQDVVVIQFDYDGNNIPTNVNNCLGDIADGGAVSVQMRSLAYYFLNQYVYTDNTYRNSKWSEHLNYEYNQDYGLLSMYYYPKMSNANFYFNDGELILSAVPSPNGADLGWEDSVVDPTDNFDDYFDEDGNLIDDGTDYGIFTPIVNFFKLIVYRLKAIYSFVRTINNAIVNAMRKVFSDPLTYLIKGINDIKEFFDNFQINMDGAFKGLIGGMGTQIIDSIKESFLSGSGISYDGDMSLLDIIGEKIVDSVKRVFLPSDGFFDEKVQQLKNKITVTFGVSAYDMSHIMSTEKAFTDIDLQYMGVTGKAVNFDYVIKSLGTFRPYIRGVITLWLVFYNVNQFLAFIGQGHISLGSLVGLGGGSAQGESKWDYLSRIAGGMK